MRELNRLIDEEKPGPPKFKCKEICIGGESFDLYIHEVIPCICALFGDPDFTKGLKLAQKHHYLDADHTVPLFSEIHTGKWWWSVQVCPNKIVPIFMYPHTAYSNH